MNQTFKAELGGGWDYLKSSRRSQDGYQRAVSRHVDDAGSEEPVPSFDGTFAGRA